MFFNVLGSQSYDCPFIGLVGMESRKKKEDNLRTSLGQIEFIKKPHEPREN